MTGEHEKALGVPGKTGIGELEYICSRCIFYQKTKSKYILLLEKRRSEPF